MTRTVDALLFDLGRVLIDIDMRRIHGRWAELAGTPLIADDATHARVVSDATFHAHERGDITDAQFWAHLRTSLDLPLTDAQFLDGWNSIFLGEVPGIRALLARVEGRLPLYVFSNTNAAHQTYWSVRFADLLRPFDRVFTSNELGARKPNPAAFRAVADAMQVPPGRILFFDDLAENIIGARACGLHAVEVASTADIEHALREHGI